MDRIDLSDDGWIELRNSEDLREGDVQDILLAIRESTADGENTLAFGYRVRSLLMTKLVTECFVPYLDDPGRLPSPAYDLVRQLKVRDARRLDAPILEAQSLLWPKPATVDDYEDPQSPTEPASG